MLDTAPDALHFANAVAQLGEKHSVVTTTAIYSTQGVKIIDQGVPVTAKLYERLMQHKTNTPLEQSMEVTSAVNGSGYPGGLAGAAISPWGRILSLAQVVAALTMPTRRHAGLRLSVLLRTSRHRYDRALVNRLLPLLQRTAEQEAEADPDGMVPVAEPVARLLAIEEALASWPRALAQAPHLTPARRASLAFIGERCADIRRTLTEAGASAEQLASLDEDSLSGLLAMELSLICRELAWQVRAMEHQALRRWALGPQENHPEALQAWIKKVGEACAGLLEA